MIYLNEYLCCSVSKKERKMIKRFFTVMISTVMLFILNLSAQAQSLDDLLPIIEKNLNEAKSDLAKNSVSEKQSVSNLIAGLDAIFKDLQSNGISERSGTDSELRPSYVVMQGIIELSLAQAFSQGLVKKIDAYIVTPRMPTPLMLQNGKTLSEINLSESTSFALYRNMILNTFLSAGGNLHAVYSSDAKASLQDQADGLNTYAAYCNKYPQTLYDHPVITIAMKDFPTDVTGAVYYLDDTLITIESKQVTQIDNTKPQSWVIRFGDKATERAAQVNAFFKANGAQNLAR